MVILHTRHCGGLSTLVGRPDEVNMPHRNRPKHGLSNTGEYLDGFGNKIYVYAVGNPKVGTKKIVTRKPIRKAVDLD